MPPNSSPRMITGSATSQPAWRSARPTVRSGTGSPEPASAGAARGGCAASGAGEFRAMRRARTSVKAISANTMRMPGPMPPANIALMLFWLTTPYMMIGRLGGNSRPMLPEAVSSPVDRSLRNPLCASSAASSPPTARMVTPEAPVKVVK